MQTGGRGAWLSTVGHGTLGQTGEAAHWPSPNDYDIKPLLGAGATSVIISDAGAEPTAYALHARGRRGLGPGEYDIRPRLGEEPCAVKMAAMVGLVVPPLTTSDEPGPGAYALPSELRTSGGSFYRPDHTGGRKPRPRRG